MLPRMLNRHPLMAFTATTRPAEALAFYRDVLGLRLVADEPFAVVFDAHGTMLRIQKAPHHVPAPHTSLGWQVEDLDASVRQLSAKGIAFVRYGFMDQNALGVWTAPDGLASHGSRTRTGTCFRSPSSERLEHYLQRLSFGSQL